MNANKNRDGYRLRELKSHSLFLLKELMRARNLGLATANLREKLDRTDREIQDLANLISSWGYQYSA